MQSTPPPEKADARLHFSAIPTSCDCLSNSGHPAETSCLQGDITGGEKTPSSPSPASLWCSAIPAGDAGSAPRRCWTMQFGIQLKRLSVVPNKLCTAYILQHFTPSGSLFSNRFPPLFMLFQIKLLIIRAKIKNERTLSEENWFSFFLNRAIARFYILCSWRSLVIQFSFY